METVLVMLADVLKRVKEDGVEFIELEFTDLFSTLKSIEIPVEGLKDALETGVWFDGSSIKGFAQIMESDMFLRLEVDTYAILPKEDGTVTARFMCDVYTSDGTLFAAHPRAVLKKAIDEAWSLGYILKFGPEIEFYLFDRKEDGTLGVPEFDSGGYFDCAAKDKSSLVRKEIMVALKEFRIYSETAHHEVGPGQHEIDFRYGDALATADKVITLKRIVKSVAHKHGLIASFMPKPLYGENGSGMHVHFSVSDTKGKPLFFDTVDKHKLSPLAKHAIAGLLHHVKDMAAVLNPTISSYKRLVPGYEAPVYICWGSRNRSSLIRVPRVTPGRESSVRAEIRCPDVSASPYLVFASLIKAVLDGIAKEMPLMPETEHNTFGKSLEEIKASGIKVMPGSLSEATSIMKKSSFMKETLGEELFTKYIEAKEKEAEEFRTAVTKWEIDRYLESC